MGLKRLSLEEAQHLIKAEHDQTDAPVYGFTLTPSTDPQLQAEGWETVTYYTNRKVRNKIPVGMQGSQWIYVLSNETMPDIVKIGFTKNKPSERVKQINSATGVAQDFIVEWAYPCFNAHDLEKEIHAYLQKEGFRVNNKKEFFYITVEDAKSVIKRIGEPYKMVIDENRK